jgi:hypothetical protein
MTEIPIPYTLCPTTGERCEAIAAMALAITVLGEEGTRGAYNKVVDVANIVPCGTHIDPNLESFTVDPKDGINKAVDFGPECAVYSAVLRAAFTNKTNTASRAVRRRNTKHRKV